MSSSKRLTRLSMVLALSATAWLGARLGSAMSAEPGLSAGSVLGLIPGSAQTVQAAERAPAAPLQATPGDPPAVPTPDPDRVWRLRLKAFPDTVGKGAYRCSGCDGVYGSGDAVASTSRALQPLLVTVVDPSDSTRVLWTGRLKRSSPGAGELTALVLLTAPPPYEVRLVDQDPRGFRLCPNAPPVQFVTQADFDAAAGSGMGAGRSYSQDWFFWSCAVDGLP